MPSQGNPINSLYHKLKLLKEKINSKSWESSNLIAAKCSEISSLQQQCQLFIDFDPLNASIFDKLKKINVDLAYYNSLWAAWTI
ncbi:hypothetical protein MA16_Dca016294 [Dendrobium catenatum]|uniref:Uncharacterized protein n=1 Tax=Dendrobium catenatum TaxID=906689 RepID=A0A2I0W869_9ASPA|nr:hypothetical protein MA16_Dca016294 [Dendrobium catenatum]